MAACFVAVALCAGSVAAGAQPASVTLTRVTVRSAGISLGYPSNWIVFVLTPKAVRAQRAALLKNNPEFAGSFDAEAQVQAARHSKFSAGDVEAKAQGRIGGAVDVAANSDFTPEELDAFSAGLLTQYKKTAGVTVLGRSTVRVSGTRCAQIDVRFTADASNGVSYNIRIAQLLAPLHGRSIRVTVAELDDVNGAAMLDQILASVRSL